MQKTVVLIGGIVVVLIVAAVALFPRFGHKNEEAQLSSLPEPTAALASPLVPTPSSVAVSVSLSPSPEAPVAAAVVYPIAEFTSRITKKPFGIHITPANSPVSPERFSGWHSGTDIEYADVPGDVPVVAIADGTILASRTVDGYGGVVIIRHAVNGETVTALYGHLDPASMVANDTQVTQGQQIGILGDGYTPETDNERKHLHFSISKGSVVNLRGYVQSEAALSDWYNPAEWLAQQ